MHLFIKFQMISLVWELREDNKRITGGHPENPL